MKVVVGSSALYFWNCSNRSPFDMDIICTKQEFKDLVKKMSRVPNSKISFEFVQGHGVCKFNHQGERLIIEASFIDESHQLQESDLEIYNLYQQGEVFNDEVIGNCTIVKPWVVRMQKESHKYKKDSVHFLKTRQDLDMMRGNALFDCEDEVLYHRLLAQREELTYNNKLPVLKTSKDNFFTDSVPYQYDHDSIHAAVAMLAKPAYTYYIADNEEVMCSKEKFFALPKIIQLYGVLEESYVLALERSIIPHGTDPKKAFDIALSKVCTSITSGWFRKFAYDNYFVVQGLYNSEFVQKFTTALESGKILPFSGNKY